VRQSGESPVDALRRTLTSLDRLIPYLPVELLPRLVSDPSRRETSSEHRLVGILFANFMGVTHSAVPGPLFEPAAGWRDGRTGKYLEGEALQRQVFRAISTLFERMAMQRPLALIFDDLHWADSASLALVECCLAITDRAPALICLIYRSDRDRECWALAQTAARNYPHRYSEIVLRPLTLIRGHAETLASGWLGELQPDQREPIGVISMLDNLIGNAQVHSR
jgi:hypothetical protein